DGKYYNTIKSGRKATFVILENSKIEDINKNYVISKEKNNQKKDEFVDIRYIKDKLIKNNSTNKDKENCSDEKDNNNINIKCVVNMLKNNEAEFDDNRSEATNSKADKSKKDYHKSIIKNEKNKQKIFVQYQNLKKISCSNKVYNNKYVNKNKRYIGLEDYNEIDTKALIYAKRRKGQCLAKVRSNPNIYL
ncbi:2494_t:CDS:2, partial [Dentiscutata heterogama]